MEWGVIAVIAVAVIFLGARLPQIARNVGKAQTEFKRGLKEGAEAEDAGPPPAETPPPSGPVAPPVAAPPPTSVEQPQTPPPAEPAP